MARQNHVGGKVALIRGVWLIGFVRAGSPSANSEVVRVALVDGDSDMESLTTMAPKGLSLDTLNLQPFLGIRGFHSADTTKADSGAIYFDNFSNTQTNDNFGVAKADDSPVI
ncbi:hypothetical protein G7Y89_g2988 [Cudoniella acicularis]|uniref:Uncharacterized protein n=1 Tax=Cudoniella acicularis TaxID=354080 RepID=A0A8H4RUB4_9HELO|nr:hypothetical protein G7Y89_g2988 [Cudoniella acicularis]